MGGVCAISVFISVISIFVCLRVGLSPYAFVSDSNTLLAVLTGLSAFLFFKNINIKQSKIINTIASSTFGVLLIHANSDTMRRWLWQTVLDVKGAFSLSTSLLILHAVLSVLGIFFICVVIDQIRIRTIETFILDKAEKGVNRLLMRRDTRE